jgi:hypothetical protein
MAHNLGHVFVVFEQHDVGHGNCSVGRCGCGKLAAKHRDGFADPEDA